VRLYSGGDERYVRGRSAYQRGLCTSPRVGEEDEGRGQRVVANGRAKEQRSLHSHAKVWLGETVGHDGVTRGGAHQVQVCLTYIHSTIICGWGVGACRRDRKWDRKATQRFKGHWATASGEMTIRDDSQASSWPSWIEALLLRERDEPTDLRGMCAFLHNSSVDLRDLAYLLSGRWRRDLL